MHLTIFQCTQDSSSKNNQKVYGLLERPTNNSKYKKHVEGHNGLCYKNEIFIPESLRPQIMACYHEYLCHPGKNCTEQTI